MLLTLDHAACFFFYFFFLRGVSCLLLLLLLLLLENRAILVRFRPSYCCCLAVVLLLSCSFFWFFVACRLAFPMAFLLVLILFYSILRPYLPPSCFSCMVGLLAKHYRQNVSMHNLSCPHWLDPRWNR